MQKQTACVLLGKGVSFTHVGDQKFKHNRLSVNLVTPLRDETAGAYAILPFLLRKGCAAYPDFTRLNQRLSELYGASLGADVSKLGANQILSLTITSVDDRFALEGEAVTAECARLLCQLLLHPNWEGGAFPKGDFQLEQQYLIDTIEAEINDKRSYAVSRLKAVMNEGDPSALGRYGTVEAARALTPEGAAEAYHRLLREAQIELMMVGAGDPAPVKAAFERELSGLDRAPVAPAQAKRPAPAEPPRERVDRMEVAQAKLVLGFRTGDCREEEKRAAVKLMAALYGGTPFSKLFMNVRERLSLCYYCAARFDRSTGILLVDSGVEFENCGRARAEILAQLAAIQAGEVGEEELENTKRLVVSSTRSAGDSLSGLESWHLTQKVLGSGLSLEEEIALTGAVTKRQLIEAARGVKLDTVYLLTGKEEKAHA